MRQHSSSVGCTGLQKKAATSFRTCRSVRTRWWKRVYLLLGYAAAEFEQTGQYVGLNVPIEPYIGGSDLYLLRGEILSPSKPVEKLKAADIEFTALRDRTHPRDLLAVQVRKNGDFHLSALDDCWRGVGERERLRCCKEGAPEEVTELCFTTLFSRSRCCVRTPASEALLRNDMDGLRAKASKFIPPLRLDEHKFHERRKRLRLGTGEGPCGELTPRYPWPDWVDGLADVSLLAAYEVLRDAGLLVGKVFQIGVSDGVSGDPIHPIILLDGNISGVGLEALPEMVNVSRQNRPGRFRVEHSVVNPQSAWFWIGPLGALDIVVVDMDSFDCDVLETILGHAAARQRKHPEIPLPALLYIELNFIIPPPFRFSRVYKPGAPPMVFKPGHYPATLSCSLSHAVHAFGAYGYDLLVFHYGNGLFVRKDLSPLYEAAFGHKLPKDEFMCYRNTVINVPTIPPSFVREWFFNANDPEDLTESHNQILINVTELTAIDGYSKHDFFVNV